MATTRKVDQLKEDLAATRKNAAARTRAEKKAQVIDGAIELGASGPGGMAAATLDHYQGEDGEVHKIGPIPTNLAGGMLLGVAGIFVPKKARMIGAGLRGFGSGMVGYSAGRYWEERLAEKDDA